MDSQSPMPEANNQIVLSEVVSKTHEEQESLSIEQGQSSEGEAPVTVEEEEEEEMEMENNNYQLMIPELEREYGCRYCRKKFSNKQALGGHQNAHKVERAMEKNEEEAGGICLNAGRYAPYHPRMSAAAAAAAAAFLSNYCHHQEYQLQHGRPLWNFIPRQMAGGSSHHNHPRPLPQGYNPNGNANANAYLYHHLQQPWPPASAQRVPAYAVNPHYALPVHIRLANFGAGSSNAFRSDSDQGFVQPGLGIRPVNLRNVPEVNHDEPGLDLSLRLGYDDA